MRQTTKAYFVTGTDTDVGKTLVSAGLLLALRQHGLTTLAIKPVAAGCDETAEGLRNEDALQLMAQMSEPLTYQQVNPVALAPAIAPHIAAQQGGEKLSLQPLVAHCQQLLERPVDVALIEGAGGWRLPLNEKEYLSGLPQALKIPVILVVGMKLGCLNHALLTAEAIARDGLQLAGWVANCIDENMSCFEENLQTLKDYFDAPLLGVVPNLQGVFIAPQAVAEYLQVGPICQRLERQP